MVPCGAHTIKFTLFVPSLLDKKMYIFGAGVLSELDRVHENSVVVVVSIMGSYYYLNKPTWEAQGSKHSLLPSNTMSLPIDNLRYSKKWLY